MSLLPRKEREERHCVHLWRCLWEGFFGSGKDGFTFLSNLVRTIWPAQFWGFPLWGSVKYQKEKTQRGKGACKSLDWNVLKKQLLPGWACGRNPRLSVYFSLLVEDTELFSSFRFLSFSCLAGQQEQMPYCVPPCPQSMRSWRESWGGAGTHVVLPTMNLQ